ncbi:MAG TPA: hypothetical protein VHY83_13700 [Solirubrobacteraceae bacterium]|nr:hypothetical protein [Solirubrobacteraceae bacterium]
MGWAKNGASTYVPLAESWSASKWTVQPAPAPPGAKESELGGEIACPFFRTFVAVGYAQNSAGINEVLAEMISY